MPRCRRERLAAPLPAGLESRDRLQSRAVPFSARSPVMSERPSIPPSVAAPILPRSETKTSRRQRTARPVTLETSGGRGQPDVPEAAVPTGAGPCGPLRAAGRDRPRRHGTGAARAATPTWAATWPSRCCSTEHADEPAAVQRFREEAQIGGQLAAPRRRAGLRAGRLRRRPALLHHEAGQGPDPGRAACASGPTRRRTGRAS